MVTGERLVELAELYAVFAKAADPLNPSVKRAERQFQLLLKKSYDQLSPTLRKNVSFDNFRYESIQSIHDTAFDNVRKFPTVLPEVKRRK